MRKHLVILFTLLVFIFIPTHTLLADEKTNIQSSISQLNSEIDTLTTDISTILAKSSDLDNEITYLQEEITNRSEQIATQARNVQVELSGTSFFTTILSVNKFSDLITIITSANALMSANDKSITELKALVEESNNKKTEYSSELSTLEDKKKDLSQKITELEEKLASLEAQEQEELKRKAEILRQNAESLTNSTPSNPSVSSGNQSYSAGQAREAFEQITAEKGITGNNKAIWADIITKESGWNTTIWNSSDSGAYGLGQALPANKMAPYGSDYMTNPYTQLKWMYDYIIGRYGSFENLAAFWAANHWY